MVVEKDFFVGYRAADVNLNMKNSAILDAFQNVAGLHGKIADEKSNNIGSVWLLISYKVNVIKRPKFGDNLKAYTWSTDIKGIESVREFEIRNEMNELVITGISNWVHLKDNKLEKIPEQLIEAYELEPQKTNYNEMRLKKLLDPEDYLYSKDYIIDWNWIDLNNHMNNTYYLDLADMLLPDELKNIKVESFEVLYKREIKYKEKVKCFYSEKDESKFITIKSEDLNTLHAIIKLN